jgi:hypothetical protein
MKNLITALVLFIGAFAFIGGPHAAAAVALAGALR